jgi:hypothetical protein
MSVVNAPPTISKTFFSKSFKFVLTVSAFLIIFLEIVVGCGN